MRNKFWMYLSAESLKIFESQNFVWFPFDFFLLEFEIEGVDLFSSVTHPRSQYHSGCLQFILAY